MDLFKYELEYQRIIDCKYVYELEEIVRKHCIGTSYWMLKNTPFDELVLSYKTLTHALKLFRTKSKKVLPDFVRDSVTNCQEELCSRVSASQALTYDEFINLFQFTEGTIQANYSTEGYNVLLAFSLIIGTNPNPYKFNWNYTTVSKYYFQSDNETLGQIMQLEHFKQTNQLVNNTIIEAELAKLYAELNDESKAAIQTNTQFIHELVDVFATINSKLAPCP